MSPILSIKSVGPRGRSDARIMLVGDTPDANATRLGQPFVGASGTLLDEMLQSSGIDPAACYFTNLSKRTAGKTLRPFFDAAGIPNAHLIEDLQTLQREIESVNPTLIIPLGSYALRFLCGKGRWDKDDGYTGIGLYRGYTLVGTALAGGRKCLPTYHPATVLGSYAFKPIVRADLARAAEESTYREVRRPIKHIIIDPRGADREAWAAWLTSPAGTLSPPLGTTGEQPEEQDHPGPIRLPSGDFLSGDIEYIGSRLLCLGLTRHADAAIVFPTRDAEDVRYIRDLLESGTPLCFQNAMFDCSILEYHYDIKCIQYLQHDTMIAMHAAYTEFPKDLGFIGSLFAPNVEPWWEGTGAGFWRDMAKQLKGTAAENAGLPRSWNKLAELESVYLPYNAVDVWVTHQAMEQLLRDELQEACVMENYLFKMQLVQALWDISKRGVRIDTEKLVALRATLESETALMEAGLARIAGAPVNVKSAPQVAKFLYDTLGVPFDPSDVTPKGARKMDDTTLSKLLLAAKSELQRTAIKLVRGTRERRDLVSKFCEIELDDDGRMRCHYDPAKTKTDRLASRKFYPTGRGSNLQNTPRASRVRAVFVPDRGNVFGYADLKSAESFIVAHITGDAEMLRLHSDEYMSGKLDGHKYVAAFLLKGDTADDVIASITKDERYLGKRVRHAGNYGLSWFRLMQLVNADAQITGVSITAAQSKSLIARYRALHPGLKNWWNDVESQLWSTRTLYNCFGRKRVFYDRVSETIPEAIAYNPQSTVAIALNKGLLRVAADAELRNLGLQMLLQVHDAIGFQIPPQNLDRAIPRLQSLMAIPIPIARRGVDPYEIIIPVEVQIGANWGEADEHNPDGLKAWRPA